MLDGTTAFASFSVDDRARAKAFYGDTLGLEVREDDNPHLLWVRADGAETLVYAKEGHEPASFTVLNFAVRDIDAAVDDLAGRGVTFERYEGSGMATDDKGVMRGDDAQLAWFKDPAGNTLSLVQT